MPATLTASEAIDKMNEFAHRADAEERSARAVSAAKTRLVLDKESESVFFATLALRLTFRHNWNTKTADVDGRTLRYNPDFVLSLTEQELIGLVAHEVLHCTGKHFARRAGRDPEEWNTACDLAINPLLLESGFELPAGGYLPGGTGFEALAPGRAAEEYFADLQALKPDPAGDETGDGAPSDGQSDPSGISTDGDNAEPGENSDGSDSAPSTDPGRCGGVIDPSTSTGDDSADGSPGDMEAADLAQLDAEWTVNIAAAQQAAQRRGTLSAGLARLCGQALAPAVDWKQQLREFITRPAKTNYNWKRPNRRHIHRGLYLPSMHSLEIGHIVAAIDTSGSISEETLTRFASELGDIATQGAARITILYHDSEIVKVEEWTPDDGPLTLTPCGGGGTDHKPVFDWIDQNMDEPPAVLIGLTDLASSFPHDEPTFPVLWASTDRHADHPFGERIDIPAA